MIRHIVMWKFREGEEENREKFLSGLQALDGVIPEIRHMEIHPRHVAVSTLCKSIRESRGAIDYEL